MSLTYAVVNGDYARHNLGEKYFYTLRDVTGDTANPSGGYAVAPEAVGLTSKIIGARLFSFPGVPPSLIGDISWDSTNNKLIFLGRTSAALVVEEVVTVTSNAGRLAKAPGYIVSIHAVAGGTTGTLRIIPTGKTTATKQVAVNFATGAIATFATDAVTSVLVTYIPLGVGQFTEANRVVDEAVTLATAGVNLASRAAVIQYVWNDTDTTHLPKLIPVGESPATHEIAIDINNAGATTITPNSAQNTNSALVTYFKYSTSWISDHSWTDQADIAVTSNAIALNEVLDIATFWIPGFGNVIVGEDGSANNLQSILLGARGAVAANVATLDPMKGALAFTSGDSYATIEMPYVLLSAVNAMAPGGAAPTGLNLSGVTARIMFIGQ